MNLRYLFFLLLFGLTLSAQDFRSVSIKINTVYEPKLLKDVFEGQNISLNNFLVPKFIYTENKEIKGIPKNLKFKVTSSRKWSVSEISRLVDVKDIPTSINQSISLVKGRGKTYPRIQLNPIYRIGSEIVQIESFQYSFTIDNKIKTRFSKVNKTNEIKNSVLRSGKWYKFAVDKTGVFKIDLEFLKSLGINTSDLDPRKIRIFGNGGAILPELLSESRKDGLKENAIWVSGENDGRFDNQDFILLYAQGSVSWELNSRADIKHKQNIYSDLAYYFINVDSGQDGKRIQNKASVSSAETKTITTFTDYQVHEKDLINYLKVGKRWFGEDFSINNSQSFEFDFQNIEISKDVSLKAEFSTKSNNVTTFSISYNNQEISKKSILASKARRFSPAPAYQVGKSEVMFKALSDKINLNLNWTTNNPSDLGRLDYIELVADRKLIGTEKQFGFVNFESKQNNEVLEYVIRQDQNIDFVWDVTDISEVKQIIDIDNSFNFKFKEITDDELKKYYVVKLSNTFSPIKLEESIVENQNLHGLQNIQYLIITPKDYQFQAERLANYHRNNTTISNTNSSFLNVEVVDVNKIYNEFGSGSADITAIRDFIKYIYDTDSLEETKLKYVCFLGDASYDYRGIIHSNKNILPVYLNEEGKDLISSYNTDDYYGYLDALDNNQDGEVNSGGLLDISLGRIPVKSIVEAKNFVDKTLNYYSIKSSGKWKTKVTLLGDDGDSNGDQGLIRDLEDSALEIEAVNKSINPEKLYSDAFKETVTSGGGSYPEIKRKFLNSFDNGALVINYFGHGNTFGLASENFLDISDIRKIRNKDNLPLFITVTCDFSKFDDPTTVTGGEELITSPFGGAGSMITTSREITIGDGDSVNKELAKLLYKYDKHTTIAEVLKNAKNNIERNGERFIFFFGDPAMRLSLPQEGIVTAEVKKVTINPETKEEVLKDVSNLEGLSKIRVAGRIENDGEINKEFNGDLFVTLFDKEIERETLLNEGRGSVVKFKSLENKIFVGEASVKNGLFSFDFILPKDISTIPGTGKFSYYAVSDKEERIGSDFDYNVGGIDVDAPKDNTPPVIQLFIGDETFLDGGNTTSTPKLLAKIQDESGINTSLNSIGHNITLVVDGDLSNPITLNEFYTTEKDDFTKGIVRYDLPELSQGNHTLTFKAWDSHNNSSTQTLTLFVQEDTGFKITNVLNYPNPFINYTEFWFKNNRTGQPLEIKAQVYTVSGKLVKTIGGVITDNSDEIQRSMKWDGRDDFGNKLGKGVYVYKLIVKETISGETAEKTEKLVIL